MPAAPTTLGLVEKPTSQLESHEEKRESGKELRIWGRGGITWGDGFLELDEERGTREAGTQVTVPTHHHHQLGVPWPGLSTPLSFLEDPDANGEKLTGHGGSRLGKLFEYPSLTESLALNCVQLASSKYKCLRQFKRKKGKKKEGRKKANSWPPFKPT